MGRCCGGEAERRYLCEFFQRSLLIPFVLAELIGILQTFRIVSRVLVVNDQPLFHSLRSWQSIQQFSSSLSSLDPRNSLQLPLLPFASSSNPASRLSIQTYIRQIVIVLSSPPQHLQDSEILSEARQILESFLLGGKDRIALSELTEWAKRGEEMDREEEAKFRVWVGMGKRVKSLRTVWVQFRRALIETGMSSSLYYQLSSKRN